MPDSIQLVLFEYLPFFAVTAIVAVSLYAVQKIFQTKMQTQSGESSFSRHFILIGLTVVGLVIVIMAFPMSDITRGQILSLLGIMLTGVIAFSSTTFVANVMAGLMLRAVKTFKPGDFVRINDNWGRVTERGLFHTEIQTEDRDLTTLPNLYLVTHPFTVVHHSGTIISTSLSLGYDLPRRDVEQLLIDAATQAELQDPFVHISELGDFSITYKVCGFLGDVKQLLTVKSNLRKKILDVLHGAGIEIVSPTFMNQRQLQPGTKQIPKQVLRETKEPESAIAEQIIFDKAETAEKLTQLREKRSAIAEEIKGLADDEAGAASKERLESQATLLDRQIESLTKKLDEKAAPPA